MNDSMKKNDKWLAVIVIVILLVLVFVGLLNDKFRIAGGWHNVIPNGPDQELHLQLYKDGTGIIEFNQGTYSIEWKRKGLQTQTSMGLQNQLFSFDIILEYQSQTYVFSGFIDNEQMTLETLGPTYQMARD